jgi:HlyD family secretion protein
MTPSRSTSLALVALLLSAVPVGAYWAFGRTVDVPVAVARPGAMAVHVIGPGTVQARTSVTLSARVSAAVRRVHVDVGDAVREGQLLVTLDDRDLSARRGVVSGQQEALLRNADVARASLMKARADLELARSKQRRDSELLAQGFVSQAAADASDAVVGGAQAGVQAAEATLSAREADARTLSAEARYADAVLSYTLIVAPIHGVVVQRLAEAGNTAVPGTALLKIVDPSSLWVATRVDESVVGRVHPGQRATITLRSGEILPGKVARIARQSDAATRELDVHVAFDTVPQRFAIDQEAKVSIDVGDDRGILAPLSALARARDGREGMFLIDGERTRFRPVEVAVADTRNMLVRQGLVEGDSFVAVAEGVSDNQRVRPASGTAP